jgi:hypothetical protein
MKYLLARPSQRIEVKRGEKARLVDQTLEVMRARGEVFDFGEGAGMARISARCR